MNPACDVAADELIAFTEEDLPERRMKELETHVPSCPACQERLTGAAETTTLLRKTMPEPDPHSRHDLLVRIYQETAHQSDHPHRGWGQVASLTAVGGTFLLAAILLWSGLAQVVDAIPRPFQQASPNQAVEWLTDDQSSDAAMFENAPMPESVGEEYPLYDQRVQSGIRLLVYHSGESGATPLEIDQYSVDDPEPPAYMEQITTVDGHSVYVDDPAFIREVRWTQDGLAHHLQMYVPEPTARNALRPEDVERIVQAFLDERSTN